MKENFLISLKYTLQYEGGYSNNPNDPGGPTNLGITWREYNLYRTQKGLPIQSVKYITDDEMHEIYKNNYWNAINGDSLASGIDFSLFDLAVNNGVGRAKQFSSVASKYHPNGPSSDIIDSICNQRLSFDKGLTNLWPVFGVGWSRRIEGVRRQAKELITKPTPNSIITNTNIISVNSNTNIIPITLTVNTNPVLISVTFKQ